MKIAIAQISSGVDKLKNLDLVAEYVEQAAQQGSELVVFPEATMRGFGTKRLDTCAEKPDGPFVRRLQELANTHNIAIVAGIFFEADSHVVSEETIQRVSNVAVAVLPNAADTAETTTGAAETVISYAKIHTFDAFGFRESDTVAPGNALVTFKYKGIAFGLAICYDLRFPELFRQLAKLGAEVILAPASWGAGAGKAEQWKLLTQARALDSGSILIACDQAVAEDSRKDGAPTGVGLSAFIDPWGQVIQQAGSGPMLLTAEIEPSEVQTARENIGVLEHTEQYSALEIQQY